MHCRRDQVGKCFHDTKRGRKQVCFGLYLHFGTYMLSSAFDCQRSTVLASELMRLLFLRWVASILSVRNRWVAPSPVWRRAARPLPASRA